MNPNFYLQKVRNYMKMLIQGHGGLPLHVFHKMKHLVSFFIKLHVDGGIERLLI